MHRAIHHPLIIIERGLVIRLGRCQGLPVRSLPASPHPVSGGDQFDPRVGSDRIFTRPGQPSSYPTLSFYRSSCFTPS